MLSDACLRPSFPSMGVLWVERCPHRTGEGPTPRPLPVTLFRNSIVEVVRKDEIALELCESALVPQSCLTLFATPWTVARQLLCPWNSPGNNTGVGSLSLLQGIFSTQGSNPGLPHCRRIVFHLSFPGSPSSPKASMTPGSL